MTARVLLVDDDPLTLLGLTATLEARLQHIAIDTCESAASALDKIAVIDYDVIVSDLKMPGMDGLALMERVLTLCPTTPILLMTGHGDHDLGVRALKAGAYAFIEKPIDREYFTAWLERAIQLRRLNRTVEEQNRDLERAVRERTAELEQKDKALHRLHTEVEHRVGVLPNFFRLAPETPEITANLWAFARFAYLDNLLPSLFKERLFVYLSRFCEVRYCIARHVGFLIGSGRPSGDSHCLVQTVEDVIRLIRRPFPRAKNLEPYVSQCTTCEPLSELPPPDSRMEEAIFVCATHAFLQTPDAPPCLEALKRVLGDSRFHYLTVFLAFVRTAHYWTRIHPELTIEEDIEQLLATHEELAECLLSDPEAGTCENSRKLMDEVIPLRKTQKGQGERAVPVLGIDHDSRHTLHAVSLLNEPSILSAENSP